VKISIASSVLILVVAAGLGWRNQQQLTIFRESYAKLKAQAAQLGIPVRSTDATESIQLTKREREDKDAAAKLVAAECIALMKDYQTDAPGSPQKDARTKHEFELRKLMLAMDAGQLKILISELDAAKGTGRDARLNLFADAVMTMSSHYPQAAIQLFSELPNFFNDDPGIIKGQSLNAAVTAWTKNDPTSAIDWMKKNASKLPTSYTEDINRSLIRGSAMNDPKLAFKLMADLASADSASSISTIISVATTPEERTNVLTALREHLTTLTDEKARNEAADIGLATLAKSLNEDGFEAASQWLTAAKLTQEETLKFVSGLESTDSNQKSQWLQWIGTALPAEKSADSIRSIVSDWTENDYLAAGKWLTTTPAGPVKNTAIRSYAETVASYEPETAAQWAMTLPAGADRDQTLVNIYRKWPTQDPVAKAAAERFKTTHGIK
jgi:hypothetical protein